ncbi:MAG: PTS IIA-like nitrogen regulatory protein PtsN, partial [Rhodoblastus sp.]|nr:PTS IIA-like nitrogen regulatory protein PtsN [Rhodoblastus sp.]
MSLNDLISPQAVIASLKANSKKQTLTELSEKAAELSGIDAREVLDALIQRERLGSTGIGGGIAIPHGKIAKCDRIFGVFARLEKPIDFEALDDAPVDLIFLLIAPENAGADHLNALSRVARALRDQSLIATL